MLLLPSFISNSSTSKTSLASSSATVTVTPAIVAASNSLALRAASTAWVMDAASFTASASWAAATVTVCAVSQLAGSEGQRVAGVTVTSSLPLLVTLITTSEVGWASSFTV